MSYLVLARKWRPQSFDEIIGQDYITKTLKNAISTGKTAHAFIFSGPRGVGKTSAARIVAKALNCQNGPTPDPCTQCDNCREIAEGKSLDVIEIDAASHTGVNDVREIIDNIKYLPTSAKNKVYIIDEVHMLSQSAFNALLKTLEEPPPHVLFILATTEVHKIPITILSRCQRYGFKKVSVENMKDTLFSIALKEKIKITEETLYIVSQEADGSMRDALSLLDQLIATFGGNVRHEDAVKSLGILDRSLIKLAVQGIIDNDPKSCIEILHQAIEKGISPGRFAEDMLKSLRHALILKTSGGQAVSDLSKEDKVEMEKITSGESIETLEMIFKLMLEEAENIQRSFYPQMALELALIKLSTIERIVPVESIIEKIENLSKSLKTTTPIPSRFDEPRESYSSVKQGEHITDETTHEMVGTANRQVENNPNAGANYRVKDFIKFVKTKKLVLGARLEQANEIILEDSTFRIVCASESPELNYLRQNSSKKVLETYLERFFSEDFKIHVEGVNLQKSDQGSNKKGTKKRIKEHPTVKDAIEVFSGRIVSVKLKNRSE